MKISLILIATFAILKTLDCCTTIRALRKAGNVEANPILRFLIERIGLVPALVVTSVAVVGGMAWALVTFPVWWLQSMAGAVCLLYFFVVQNNISKS